MSKHKDYVLVDLDRQRKLRFGHKALKEIESRFGSLDKLEESNFSFEELEILFYCGLRGEDKELKLEDMEDLLDCAPMSVLSEALGQAMEYAIGTGENTVTFPEPGKKPATK